MRTQLTAYNKLLEKSFIDIQKYDVPRILINPKKRRRTTEPKYVYLSHHHKFVRRVFNNSPLKKVDVTMVGGGKE